MTAPLRRSFTLIETMLAASLGALVLVGILGVAALVDRSETGSSTRLARTSELEQAQTVIRRALGSLAMAGGSAPVQQQGRQGSQNSTAPAAATPTYTPTPRLVLAPMDIDPFAAAAMGEEISGLRAGPQRVQFALTMLPLPERAFVAPTGLMSGGMGMSVGTAPSSRSASEREEEPPIEEETGEGESAESSEMVPIFWGALELTPPDLLSESPEQEGWTLWWRQIAQPPNPTAGLETFAAQPPRIADPRMDPAAVALVRGIASCKWSVYKGRELLPAHAATYSSELPAYMQLEIRTVAGVYANWMFELGWATVQEPSQVAAAREAARLREAQGPGGGGAGEGRGGPGGQGGGGLARPARPRGERGPGGGPGGGPVGPGGGGPRMERGPAQTIRDGGGGPS
ncbi:MAG: hypothetical protein KF912_04875 [Phycisphaeraceae bacterium]|nr:hypothetical protein [Phycisphaeraceae bacterium]